MLVFVYGTLKKGHGNHRLLTNAKFIKTAETMPKYTMFDTGGFPAVIPVGNTSIKGEIYEVTQDEARSLDSLEGYPSMYDREETPLLGEEMTPWMYLWQYSTNRMPIKENGVW